MPDGERFYRFSNPERRSLFWERYPDFRAQILVNGVRGNLRSRTHMDDFATCWTFPPTQDLSNRPLACSAVISSRLPLVRFFNG
jgi:hypothetical protein